VIKLEGGGNTLPERLRADPAFRAVAGRLTELLEPERYVGRAPEQVDEFVAEEVDALLARFAGEDLPAGRVEL
jgi:adenylosuccinate lyase